MLILLIPKAQQLFLLDLCLGWLREELTWQSDADDPAAAEGNELLLITADSHLKNSHPFWTLPTPPERRTGQQKKPRPWFGPPLDTSCRFARRPQEQSGDVTLWPPVNEQLLRAQRMLADTDVRTPFVAQKESLEGLTGSA